MPYKLRKAPNRDLYWVVNKETGEKYSKEPLPKERAMAQMKALYANTDNERKGKGTHRENVIKKYKLPDHNDLESLAKETGISLTTLQEVYNRGIGAYKTNPSSVRMKGSFKKGVNAPMSQKLSKEQWALARVYSYIDGNKKHDKDLRGGVSEEVNPKIHTKSGGVIIPKADFIKEHENLLKILNKGKPSELKAEARDQKKELKKVMKGGAIHRSILQQMAQSAYSGRTHLVIGPYKLVYSTPTLKFYMNENKEVVVAIRGTSLPDAEDIEADRLALTNHLSSSRRYKKDLHTLEDFQKKFPKSEYHYIGVGHSLGGAILDLFLRAGLLSNGLSYNALVEPKELKGNPNHYRVYHKDDPLYKIIGWQIPKVEVVSSREPFWKVLLEHALPFGLGTLFKAYDSHMIDRFR